MKNTFYSRPYQASDMDLISAVIKARPTNHILDYPALADIEETLVLPEIQATTRVWETQNGSYAGYAFLNHGSEYATLSFEAAPGSRGEELELEMLVWGEQIYCQEYKGTADELSTSVTADQIERIDLLERRGYQRDLESAVYYHRPLDRLIPAPHLPKGFTIRSLKGREETAAWVALHRAAFQTENMTVEARLAMMDAPSYVPELDLVAVAPDGCLAAYVFGSIHAEENVLTGEKTGWTDPVATHPAYRRIGLSRALLLENMLRMKALGMQYARLGTSSENTAMQRTAESVGFELVGQAYHYCKKRYELRGG